MISAVGFHQNAGLAWRGAFGIWSTIRRLVKPPVPLHQWRNTETIAKLGLRSFILPPCWDTSGRTIGQIATTKVDYFYRRRLGDFTMRRVKCLTCRCAKFAENGARGNPAANHRGLSRRPRVVRGRSLLRSPRYLFFDLRVRRTRQESGRTLRFTQGDNPGVPIFCGLI